MANRISIQFSVFTYTLALDGLPLLDRRDPRAPGKPREVKTFSPKFRQLLARFSALSVGPSNAQYQTIFLAQFESPAQPSVLLLTSSSPVKAFALTPSRPRVGAISAVAWRTGETCVASCRSKAGARVVSSHRRTRPPTAPLPPGREVLQRLLFPRP